MKTFTVVYVGQARYLECIEYHKSIIAGYSKISASLSPNLVELWRMPSEVTHSINGNLTEEEILNKLHSMSIFDDIKILNHNDYEGFDYESIDFYPCAYMYSLYKSLDNIDTDFVVFLTTDLIFDKTGDPVSKYIESLPIEDIPKAYVQLININMLKPFFVCVNRKGINKIKSRFLDSLENYFKNTSEYKLKNEYATYTILNICGLKIEHRGFKTSMHRFRPNMSLDNIVNFNFNEVEKLRKEYSLNKADRNRRRNEIVKPFQQKSSD